MTFSWAQFRPKAETATIFLSYICLLASLTKFFFCFISFRSPAAYPIPYAQLFPWKAFDNAGKSNVYFKSRYVFFITQNHNHQAHNPLNHQHHHLWKLQMSVCRVLQLFDRSVGVEQQQRNREQAERGREGGRERERVALSPFSSSPSPALGLLIPVFTRFSFSLWWW